MEQARNNGDKLKNVAALEAQPSSVHGVHSEGANIAQAGAIYMECRRNFVASIGGYMIDGCRVFVQRAGCRQDDNMESLLCANCGCHRSFHRKILLPPHLRDARRCCIVNYLRSFPLRVMQPRPPTPWLMQLRTLTNYELIEGQGSSMSPNEGDEEKSKSDGEDEVNQPSENIKAG